jgi:hypothetical protein
MKIRLRDAHAVELRPEHGLRHRGALSSLARGATLATRKTKSRIVTSGAAVTPAAGQRMSSSVHCRRLLAIRKFWQRFPY